MSPGESRVVAGGPVVIRVESGESFWKAAIRWGLLAALAFSVLLNLILMVASVSTESSDLHVQEAFRSGSRTSSNRIAVISVSGTIMPPFTERWLKQIEKASEDDSVKGILLAIDSPGGFVADSHQMYHELQKLRKSKPVYVAMKRLAASGGYYIAMGIGPEGKIFVEPTTWTGSIGVIIPRYNATELAEKIGVTVEPLTTGPLKDTLNPFRQMSERERGVWDAVMKDSFDRFIGVIQENRSTLDEQQTRDLATGQIYTAGQALENGMVDAEGYEEDALKALTDKLGLSDYKVVEYSSPPTFADLFLTSRAEARASFAQQLMDAATPRALYYCSWNPWVPASAGH
ncbi:MAG: signal peptide peptidase SppA [Planctomycetaceae bacterium]